MYYYQEFVKKKLNPVFFLNQTFVNPGMLSAKKASITITFAIGSSWKETFWLKAHQSPDMMLGPIGQKTLPCYKYTFYTFLLRSVP